MMIQFSEYTKMVHSRKSSLPDTAGSRPHPTIIAFSDEIRATSLLASSLSMQTKENFGMCNNNSSNDAEDKEAGCYVAGLKVDNVPRRINVEDGNSILVEPEYQTAFWGSVDFDPVPRFFINTHDPVNQDVYISGSVHHIHQRGPWDPYIWNLFVNTLSKKAGHDKIVVVDVGANLGYFSLLAASMGFKVVSFEPMNRNVAKFLSSIARNHFEDKVILYQNAMTYSSCDSVWMTETHSSNQGNGKIQRRATSKQGTYGRDYVETIRIDDAIHDTDVLWMKIDVEGSEGAVLNGAKRLICWNLVLYNTIEFSDDTRHSQDCPAGRMLQLLESIGYAISDVVAEYSDATLSASTSLEEFPPNILFRLLNTSSPPGHRLGPNSACS